MRVIFLSDDFPPESFGGAGISTYELALGMKKNGQDVFVVTTCRKKSEAGESVYNGLKVFKIYSNYHEKWRAYLSIYNPSVIKELEKLFQKIKPDLVWINNVHYHLSYYSIKLSKRYAETVVVTLRDAMSFSFGKLQTEKYLNNMDAKLSWLDQIKQAKKRWNPLRNLLIRYYLGCADKVFAVSDALKKALLQNGIKGVEVMHTGIDVSKWKVSDEDISAFKFKYDLNNKKVIFSGGRLTVEKGKDVATEVANAVSKEFPDTILFSPGTNAKWLGREEMKIAYAASDIVLVPSVCFDAFPRTVLEAMAVGKPVIGTRYGGASEAILEGITGYVFDPRSVKEISDKIIELFKNKEKYKKFSEVAKMRIETNFNLDNKISEFLNTIKNR